MKTSCEKTKTYLFFLYSRGVNFKISFISSLGNKFQANYEFMSESGKPITQMLLEIKQGNSEALNPLLPLVYDELRRLAKSYLNHERVNHTLQPTALVHETFLRLVDQRKVDWQDRAHFFGIAARLMREILIDYARARKSQKRGGEFLTMIALDDAISFHYDQDLDLLALDELLTQLATLDERQVRIIEMRFFAGLNVEETAEAMQISPATVKRDWQTAKLWLLRKLSEK